MTQAASPWVLGARSETGFVRSVNEDRMGWTRTRFGDVFVVSDGMGGHRGGALAAEITVRVLQEQLANIPPGSERFSDHIHQAFQTANREVFSTRDPSDPETREMGATAVALVSDGARVMVAHVGDSRAYLWRRSQGLRQLTRDHTRVQSMMDAGLLTPEQAVVHPQASVLDRAMGHAATVSLDVTDWIELERGDMLMLCSDGLSGYVPDPAIETVLRAAGDPQSTTDRLIDCALQAGGKDNVTVQLVRFAPAGRGALGRLLARPTASVPLSVLATLALAGAAGWQATASYRQTIGQLQAALGSQSAASAASAASGASAASAASAAASSASASASSADAASAATPSASASSALAALAASASASRSASAPKQPAKGAAPNPPARAASAKPASARPAPKPSKPAPSAPDAPASGAALESGGLTAPPPVRSIP